MHFARIVRAALAVVATLAAVVLLLMLGAMLDPRFAAGDGVKDEARVPHSERVGDQALHRTLVRDSRLDFNERCEHYIPNIGIASLRPGLELIGVEQLLRARGWVEDSTLDGRGDATLMRTDDEDPAMSSFTLYTTPWCGYCKRLMSQLEREGIGYDVVDIEQQPEAAAIVESANNGNQTVPTLVFSDGTALTNPSVIQVKAKLAELG